MEIGTLTHESRTPHPGFHHGWGLDKRLRFMTDLIAPLRVPPGSEVKLSRDHDPGYTGQVARPQAAALLAEGVQLLADYQDRLAAQDTFGVLLVLQGLDASGKDSTIKHVMSGVNPQAVEVRAFKQPSAEELDHDFLWRYQRALPGRGRIGIFNRSHYEEVLVVRVHQDLLAAERMPAVGGDRGLWARRYREINDWERYLVGNGVHVVKVMLTCRSGSRPSGSSSASTIRRRTGSSLPATSGSGVTGTSTSGPSRPCWARPARPGRRGTSCRPTTSGSAGWPPPRSW